MTQTHMNLVEIPITIRIKGNPVPIANKIFAVKEGSKDETFPFTTSVLVSDDIECRLKEYIYRNEVDLPQDLVLVFGVVGARPKSSAISNFLYENLKEFKKILLIINKQEVSIDHDMICTHMEKWESNGYS